MRFTSFHLMTGPVANDGCPLCHHSVSRLRTRFSAALPDQYSIPAIHPQSSSSSFADTSNYIPRRRRVHVCSCSELGGTERLALGAAGQPCRCDGERRGFEASLCGVEPSEATRKVLDENRP